MFNPGRQRRPHGWRPITVSYLMTVLIVSGVVAGFGPNALAQRAKP